MKGKKLTTEEFVRKSKEVHGEKYDYSSVEYIGANYKVLITCPIHGIFEQRASAHLDGQGCPLCGEKEKANNRRKHRTALGVILTKDFICNKPSYMVWKDMLRRCYRRGNSNKWKAYEGCVVCDEWLIFDNFDAWYSSRYVEGWHLDKDILVKGNKVYSPDTCCLVPEEINQCFKRTTKDSGLPRGVKRIGNKYSVELQMQRKRYYLGVFNTVEEADRAFQNKKKELLAQLAEKYKDKLEDRVYNRLTEETEDEK